MDSKNNAHGPPMRWAAVFSLWGQGSRTCVPRTACHCHQGFRGVRRCDWHLVHIDKVGH